MSARWIVPVGIVAVAMVTALVTAPGTSQEPRAAGPDPVATSSSAPPQELVPFDGGRFTIGYPRGWRPVESPDPQVALVAVGDRGGSLLVRVSQPGFTIDGPEQLGEAQRFTDRIVTGGRGVELLAQPARIELAGLPGWYYFYTFEDEVSGGRGAHAHYFVFDGATLFSLVFQALPTEAFVDLAPTFDAVAASFTVNPQAAPSG